MKIIDEKGRLFGKINLIDFLVILALLIVIPMAYFGYRVSKIKAPAPYVRAQWQPEQFTLTIKGKIVRTNAKVIQKIAVGDKEFDDYGKLIGEITELGKPGPYTYSFNLGPHYKIVRQDPELLEMPVTLKIIPTVRDEQNLFYKNTKIFATGPLDFATKKYSLEVNNIVIIGDEYNKIINSEMEYASDKDEIVKTLKQQIDYGFSGVYGSLEKLIDLLQTEGRLDKKFRAR